MTTYHVVWWLVLLMSVAVNTDKSTWNPRCKIGGVICICEVVGGLKSVTCRHKGIAQTPINRFPFPGGTQSVDLSNNELYVLGDNAFNQFLKDDDQGLGYLLKFNFSSNSISPIRVNAFKYVDNLLILDVSYNNIEKLIPNTFKNLGKLQELYLHHNPIQTLEQFTFQGLISLEILDLSNCYISKISWWAFYFSNSPKLLNLEDNLLTTFHSNYIYSPVSLNFSEGMNLLNNNIICDCNLKRFYRDTLTAVGQYNLTCIAPERVRNHHMTALFDEDFQPCRKQPLIGHIDKIVEGFASNTTTLGCQSIPGPLFKNWTISSNEDGQIITLWPERFKLSQSPTWVNLTISNTQKSDEGNYTCIVSERMNGTGRLNTATVMLVVQTPDEPEEAPGDDTRWLIVLTIAAVLILFVVMVIVIIIIITRRKRSRKEEVVPDDIYEPWDYTSHMYEDVDQELRRLAQRSLPHLPNDTAQSQPQPQPKPQPQSHYMQHCIKMKPLYTPESSISSMSTNDISYDHSKGPSTTK